MKWTHDTVRGNLKSNFWKIHLFMMMTVTLKTHHWTMARRDLKTLHWHSTPSSIVAAPNPFLLLLLLRRAQKRREEKRRGEGKKPNRIPAARRSSIDRSKAAPQKEGEREGERERRREGECEGVRNGGREGGEGLVVPCDARRLCCCRDALNSKRLSSPLALPRHGFFGLLPLLSSL